MDHISNSIEQDLSGKSERSGSLQQTDLLREFYLSIAEKGLGWTFKQSMFRHHSTVSRDEIDLDLPIIIVGAGMSGLVAGYELKRAGYKVKILEMSERFGGRVKTLGMKEGFDRGLHADGELYYRNTYIVPKHTLYYTYINILVWPTSMNSRNRFRGQRKYYKILTVRNCAKE